jgi:hypothetical protein
MRVSLVFDPIERQQKSKNGKTTLYTPNTGVTTKMLYPTKNLINQLVAFFSTYNFMPNISEIEFTLDFYTEQIELLRQFLRLHRFTKYNRGEAFDYKDTTYAFKKKKGKRYSKGLRIYPKDEDNIEGAPVRSEVTVKRQIISREKLELHVLDEQLKKFDLQRFFDFRYFNAEEYKRKWTERARRARFTKDKLQNYRNTENWNVESSMDLSQRHIESWLDSYLFDGDYGYKPRSLDGIVRALKDSNEYSSDYIKKMDDLNEEFFNKLKGRSFLL